MKETYEKAMNQVYLDEGGYTNEKSDPGGPTNYGITIHDAQTYWKSNATADDVRNMPKSVAEEIYAKHYAEPLHYDELPAGIDYAVLDYGINSGIFKASKVLQHIAGVAEDGEIGPVTLSAVDKLDPVRTINSIYDERLNFLSHLKNYPVYKNGWTRRCNNGRRLALSMVTNKPTTVPSGSWNSIVDTLLNLLATLFKRK